MTETTIHTKIFSGNFLQRGGEGRGDAVSRNKLSISYFPFYVHLDSLKTIPLTLIGIGSENFVSVRIPLHPMNI